MKTIWGGIGVVAVLFSILGVTVFGDVRVSDLWSSDSDDSYVSAAGGPPDLPVEIKARTGRTVFADDVSVSVGEAFQVFVFVGNIGQMDASGVTFRVALPDGIAYRPGSCRMRSGGDEDLRPCPDNLVNGGFAYNQVAQGGWTQVYFAAELPKSSTDGRVRTLHVLINSNETPELMDSVRIHPVVG